MEKFISILTMLILFTACSKEELVDTSIVGKWNLIQTSGMVIGSSRTGDEMPFQENYHFKANWTFVKTRIKDQQTLTVSGTYLEVNYSELMEDAGIDRHIELILPSSSTITATCNRGQKEYLFFREGQMNNNWIACDGMGLVYSKIK